LTTRRRRLGQWLWCLLALAWAGEQAWAQAASVPATPAYQFRPPARQNLPQLLDQLDAAERSFIASLPVVRVGLNLPDNRPYEVIAANGEVSGIQIDTLTQIARALGVRVQPVVLSNFSDALTALRDRRVDVMSTVGYESSREAYMAYTLGTAPNPGAVIGRAADKRFAENPSLNGRRVAIERGYVTQFYAQRLWPEVQIDNHDNTAAALRAVARGDDDFYFGSLLMALDRLQREGIDGLAVKHSLVYATGQMHFGVRSDWPLLASALSKGVAALRQSPLPSLQLALDAVGQQAEGLPRPMALGPQEQRQLAGHSVLRVGAVRGLSLLNEATPGGGHAGIGADYTVQVAARLGLAIDVVPFDSVAQLLDALRAGRIHLAPLLTRTPERAKALAFSDPYLEMPYHVIARSDAPMYWDLASLHGKRLALTAQHPLREFLAQRYPDIQIVDAPPGDGAMDLVASGGADAAVEAKLYANLRINSDNNGLLRQVSRVDEIPAQFHFATSPGAASLVPLINRALADIPAAERDRLYRRWVAVDVQPGFAWRRWAPLIATGTTALLLLAGVSAWWMRRLHREVERRGQAEQRLRAVANSLPGVVFQYVTTDDGRVLQRYFSEAVDDFLGPGLADAPSLFEAVARRTPPAQAALLRAARLDSAARHRPFKHTVQYDDPRRGPRWLHCEAAVRPLDGGRMAWTGYVVDVSTERALQAQLLDAVQAKNLFVASASHELRAPLHAITLALQRLGDGPLDSAQRGVWRIAQDASAALVQLIDDVLDLARIDSGQLRLAPRPVDLPALLTQISEPHRLAAEARGLQFTLALAPDLPARAQLDALRLRQLLSNLIGNAIKYTPQGGVTVRATLDAQGAPLLAGPVNSPAASAGLRLVVQDTGIGIPPERQETLFEPFGHAPASLPLGERSHGLGLAICKRLVQAMRGEITLGSVADVGTEVVVRLPLPAPGVPEPLTVRQGPLLLVDDDEVSRALMAEVLRGAGHVVLEAAGAEAALACWQQHALAAVISDRHMPGGDDGPVLLAKIQADARAQGRPLPACLLCTGSPDEPSEATLDAVLSKPVRPQDLHAALAAAGVLPAHG
jgi:two-component system sensor histidine kinase EvgS